MLRSFLLIFATLTSSCQQETRAESQVLTRRRLRSKGLSRIPHLWAPRAAAGEAVRAARDASVVPETTEGERKSPVRRLSDEARGDFRKAKCGNVGESDPGAGERVGGGGKVLFAVGFV